jgi:hypothetical protein
MSEQDIRRNRQSLQPVLVVHEGIGSLLSNIGYDDGKAGAKGQPVVGQNNRMVRISMSLHMMALIYFCARSYTD